METLKNEFEKIKCLDDLQSYIVDTEDGESAILEFKSLHSDSFNSKKVGETKAKLAKEMCAFLNTNDGMIVWGGDIDKATHKLVIKNDSNENLTNFLDTVKLTLTEPAPVGIRSKIISDEANNSALLIFVPKSNFAPHRVGSWDVDEGKKGKDKIVGRYFQRIGTSSQVMPENLVRSMYLSSGRLPVVEVRTILDKIVSSNKLTLSAYIQPDRFEFIESYHLTQEVALIGDWLNILNQECVWCNLDDYEISPARLPYIFPSENAYTLWSNSILSDKESNAVSEQDPIQDLLSDNSSFPDGDIHLCGGEFNQIFSVATRTAFAAKGIQIKYKICLYIIGLQPNWQLLIRSGQSREQFRRVAKLQELEDKYDVEIYISLLYKDDEIIDDRPNNLAEVDDVRLKISHIEQLLRNLVGN